jgi:hypothetical protein
VKSNELFVSDMPNSALSTVARSRAKNLKASVIYASDFKSPEAILEFISQEKYSRVMFSWRGALKEGLKIPRFRKIYSDLASTVTFQCLIPDFVGLETRFLQEEEDLLRSIHGYWVTCEILFQTYCQRFPGFSPSGILHDMPDDESIRRNYSNSQELQIVWVGNSAWGQRMGFTDHKGFYSLLIPLASRYRILRPEIEFKILDSHKNRIMNQQVLNIIGRSRVVLQTSKSEGTGLPILEALGLGVVPISTDVGVAREVLTGVLSKFIVRPNTLDFQNALDEALQFTDRDRLRGAYLEYLKRAEGEMISWEFRKIEFPKFQAEWRAMLEIRLLWLYRYLKSRKSEVLDSGNNAAG